MKMVAALMIDQYNNKQRAKGEMPLAKEVIRHEKANIGFARDHFEDGNYLSLVNNYTT